MHVIKKLKLLGYNPENKKISVSGQEKTTNKKKGRLEFLAKASIFCLNERENRRRTKVR